jgi:hypothetical protein
MTMKKITIVLLALALQLWAGHAGAQNVLKNGSFEDEDSGKPGQAADWGGFTQTGEPGTSCISKESAKDGKNAYKVAFEGKTEQYVGLSQNVPIKAGQKVKLSCFVRNLTLQNQSYAQLGLEWKDAGGKEVSRDLGEGMNAKNATGTDWTRFEVLATAPPNAESVTVVVTLHASGSTDGAVLLDQIALEVVQ